MGYGSTDTDVSAGAVTLHVKADYQNHGKGLPGTHEKPEHDRNGATSRVPKAYIALPSSSNIQQNEHGRPEGGENDKDEHDEDDGGDAGEVSLANEESSLLPQRNTHVSFRSNRRGRNVFKAAFMRPFQRFSTSARVQPDESTTGDGGASSTSGGATPAPWERQPPEIGLLFWTSCLVAAYATERCTFKVLVDNAGPFRLLTAEAVAGTHALVLAIVVLVPSLISRTFDFTSLKVLPIVDLGSIAVMDSIHLLLSVVSGSHVAPVLTVMLVQLTVPVTVCIVQCSHKDGACGCIRRSCCSDDGDGEADGDEEGEGGGRVGSPSAGGDENATTSIGDGHTARPVKLGGLTHRHIIGAAIITLALLLGLCPAVLHLVRPNVIPGEYMSTRTSWNTIMFASASVPAAASTLMKERALTTLRQPVDTNQLNFVLAVAQFVMVGVVSPLFYPLQGMAAGSGWIEDYPSRDISANFLDGMACFVGMLSSTAAEHAYAEPARCGVVDWVLVLAHVISIVLIGVAATNVVHHGATRMVYRGITLGLVLAVGIMYLYDVLAAGFDGGPIVKGLYLCCLLLLIPGLEIYYRTGLPDETFETVYPEVENFDGDE